MSEDDERITLNATLDVSTPAPSSDESDIGIRRQFKAMRARLQELEALYAGRFRYQVPTALTEREIGPHGLKCGFHPHVTISMRTPTVRCTVCDTRLDPIEVLRDFARDERNFAHTLEHLRTERATLSKEVEDLKRQRANLRAQIKRALRPKGPG